MAAGAPVLTSNVSSLPEVGGEAAAYADPFDADDIARGLAQLLSDAARRRAMQDAGRAWAAEFSWSAFAAAVLGRLQAAACPASGAGDQARTRA
jgi:glycosyltransferase involved in cell wall biosynthesis